MLTAGPSSSRWKTSRPAGSGVRRAVPRRGDFTAWCVGPGVPPGTATVPDQDLADVAAEGDQKFGHLGTPVAPSLRNPSTISSISSMLAGL